MNKLFSQPKQIRIAQPVLPVTQLPPALYWITHLAREKGVQHHAPRVVRIYLDDTWPASRAAIRVHQLRIGIIPVIGTGFSAAGVEPDCVGHIKELNS
jgi:hypothetical protein